MFKTNTCLIFYPEHLSKRHSQSFEHYQGLGLSNSQKYIQQIFCRHLNQPNGKNLLKIFLKKLK